MRIDLHLHSTASDGAVAPAEVAQQARDGGLDVVALADHDTVSGVPAALAAADPDLQIVPAIEISASHRGRDIHILGYGIDIEHPAIRRHAERARVARVTRIQGMISRLGELGVDVEFEDVLDEAGPDASALARPHLARVLWHAGDVGSVGEAFDRYLADDGPAHVPLVLDEVATAIRRIHDAGGLAVWAHPPLPLLGGALREFVDAGLDGLECYRPRLGPPELNRLLNKARQHDLLVTGGSDWHGDWHGPLGSFHVESHEIRPFLARLHL